MTSSALGVNGLGIARRAADHLARPLAQVVPLVGRRHPSRVDRLLRLQEFIFGLLFLKRLSDRFDEECEALVAGRHDPEDVDEHDFFVPKRARWSEIQKVATNIGETLNKACAALEEKNTALEGVLAGIDYNDERKLGEALRAHGRDVEINVGPRTASFVARHEGKEELNYRVEHQRGTKVAPVVTFTDRSDGKRYSGLGYFRSGSQDYGVADLTKDEIVQHMTNEYRMTMSPRP